MHACMSQEEIRASIIIQPAAGKISLQPSLQPTYIMVSSSLLMYDSLICLTDFLGFCV